MVVRDEILEKSSYLDRGPNIQTLIATISMVTYGKVKSLISDCLEPDDQRYGLILGDAMPS